VCVCVCVCARACVCTCLCAWVGCTADVAQSIHYFLHAGGMDKWLGDTLVLACITAALVHDVVRARVHQRPRCVGRVVGALTDPRAVFAARATRV